MTQLAHDPAAAQDTHHHGVPHVMPVSTLIATAAALLVLTWLTWFVYDQTDFGSFNTLIALGIAAIKATLVLLYFMHLRYDRPFNAIILIASLFFVALFLAFSVIDMQQNQSVITWKAAPFYERQAPPGE